jgi:hypothetical protein
VFVSAVVRDFDGDDSKDAFALVRPADGSGSASVAYARGQGLPTLTLTSAAAPPPLRRDAACTDVAKLSAVGRRSVLAEVGAQCPAGGQGAGADRWVAFLDAGPSAAVLRLAISVTDPPGAGALSFDGEVTDRDGDGRDDARLVVTLDGAGPPFEPGPRVSASFVWLDRPAGLSPDPHAAEGSFAGLASQAAARAGRAHEAAEVSPFVAQVGALWRAACAEGGVARVVGVAGTSGLACGGAKPLEDAELAEAHARATLGDALGAALTLDRVERSPAAPAAARLADAEKWITAIAPASTATSVRAVSAVPATATGHEPAWGALAFETSGKLLVRTRAGVVRVDPDAGDEAAADGVTWKAGVSSPDGAMHWIEAYDACDGLGLRATFASGDDMRDVQLPALPLTGVRCAGSRGGPAWTVPVAWTAAGLEAIVEGVPLLVAADLSRASLLSTFLDTAAQPGAPLSPDGKTLVVPTRFGLLEKGPARTRLLRAPALDGTYAEQRDCVPGNDGRHVACARAGKAWVGTWD